MGKRIKINAGRPCVVKHRESAVGMRRLRDRGNVLHLHRDGAGTLTPHQPRVGAKFILDRRARTRWIIAHLYAKAAQHAVGEHAIRSINALRQQHMVAALKQRQMDQRNGRLSAGSNDGAKAAFQFAHLRGKFQRGRRTVKPVGIADFMLVPPVAGRRRLIKKNRRSSIDRSRKRAKTFGHLGIRMDEPGLPIFSLPIFPVLIFTLLIVLIGHKLKIVAWQSPTRRHAIASLTQLFCLHRQQLVA
jgi:hypothetical protein